MSATKNTSATTKNILVLCDPEEDFLEWASNRLACEEIEIFTTTSSEKALDFVEKKEVAVLLANAECAPIDGETLLRKSKLLRPQTLVILTSNFPPSGAVIRAMSLGAHDYVSTLTASYDIRKLIEPAMRVYEGSTAGSVEKSKKKTTSTAEDGLISRSPAMQEIVKLVGRIARSQIPVLITGDSGSGKEVVAKTIHQHSFRADEEFVAINCAAIPESLLESELFGHEKGSFTGALSRRIGRFEQASKGTLFLDEIGDMPMAVQAKLLRVLQQKEFSRVGGNETIATETRVIAATHHNLEEAIANERFREDLYYRLNVVHIPIPPLKQRKEDILPLTQLFLKRLHTHHDLPPVSISEEAIYALEQYDWPGNVRELENTLHRAAVIANREILLAEDLPLGKKGKTTHVENKQESLSVQQRVETLADQLCEEIRLKGNLSLQNEVIQMLEQIQFTPR